MTCPGKTVPNVTAKDNFIQDRYSRNQDCCRKKENELNFTDTKSDK